MPKIVIEANIGAGKSTLLRHLETLGHTVFQEPVEEWEDILKDFYKDPSRWSFLFQMQVLHSFLKPYPEDCIVERSPYATRYVFGQTLTSTGHLSEKEFTLFKQIFDSYAWKPTHVIYINTDPKICLERIQKRQRDGESAMGLAYLNKIAFQYEKMFQYIKFDHYWEVDGNQTEEKVVEDVVKIMEALKVDE